MIADLKVAADIFGTQHWVLWVSNATLCGGQYWSKWGELQSHVKLPFFYSICVLSGSLFSPLSFLFCSSFIFLCWLVLTDDSLWHLLENFLFYLFLKKNRLFYLAFSPRLSFFFRASVLWLLPFCTSSSWRPSAGCWQRRGSPTWLSLAKWGHDSFASVFCASAGVSIHEH